jgi:dTMP kinase
MAKKGRFIVFEGIDASGKSYLVDSAEKTLNSLGYKSIKTKEPSDSDIGLFLREVLRKERILKSNFSTQLLFWADRAEHIEAEIMPSILKGINVISDRYMYSTLAYGAASGLPNDQMRAFYGLSSAFLKPDAIFYLDCPAKVSIKRMEGRGKARELFEKEEFLERVRKEYLKMSKKYYFIKLDSTLTLPELEQLVSSSLMRMFKY